MDDATSRILDHTLIGEAMLGAGVAVFVTDDDGNYIAVNDAAQELLGYTREEFRKLSVGAVTGLSEEERAALVVRVNRERALEGTTRLRCKDGSVGTIRHFTFHGSVGGLPVLVSVTAPVQEFELESA
jgi:PAS domain S-box-containing protein